VVGRSFGGLGGSDPIEPIALGKATVTGPEVANFRAVVDEFARAGAIVVADAASLGATLARLLEDRAERARLAEAGRACIHANQGATERHAAMLDTLVRGSPAFSSRMSAASR
jgi:3-deoxy-D-manno-octulosonic-acid transferase